MITNENKKLIFAMLISTTLVSCFGADKTESIGDTTDFTEKDVTVLPVDNLELKIIQDINNKQEYEFTN